MRIYALILAAALAGCATTEDLPTVQRRALAAIQTAQSASTQLLVAGKITPEQDRDAQVKLAAARSNVRIATTPAEVNSATASVGVTP